MAADARPSTPPLGSGRTGVQHGCLRRSTLVAGPVRPKAPRSARPASTNATATATASAACRPLPQQTQIATADRTPTLPPSRERASGVVASIVRELVWDSSGVLSPGAARSEIEASVWRPCSSLPRSAQRTVPSGSVLIMRCMNTVWRLWVAPTRFQPSTSRTGTAPCTYPLQLSTPSERRSAA
jgi:hypothetical protein